jgi:methyl-accepting chemotaxis protein
MRFRLADLSLLAKIGFAPALALAVMAAITVFSVVAQRQSAAELQRAVHVDMATMSHIQKMSEQVEESHGRLYMLLTHQAGKIDQNKIESQVKQLVSDMADIQHDIDGLSKVVDPSQRPLLVKLSKQMGDTRSAVDLVGSMMTADFSAAASFIDPFEQSYRQMIATLNDVVTTNEAATAARAVRSEAQVSRNQNILVVAGSITFLLVMALAALTVLATRADIKGIAGATEALAGGDNDIDLDTLKRRDELGAIVRSLVVFRDNQLSVVALRKEQEARKVAQEAEDAKRTEEQAQVMELLGRGLDHLASGDLSYRISKDFPPDSAQLKADFNRAMGELESTLQVITGVTAKIYAETAGGAKGTAAAGKSTLQETGKALEAALDAFRENEKRIIALREETARASEAKAKEQAAVVSALSGGLEKLAAGDMTYRIASDFPAEYRALKDNFNAALETIERALGTVLQATRNIQTGAGEISKASDDLSHRTEQQAASLEETAAALEQITATVKRTADNAQSASSIVSSAKVSAENGGHVVDHAIGAMGQIEQSSKKITDIIGVMDEISFQTNLLALNAGVEAARAGEAGRGFAVVASEVRSLAQRSSEAARQIKTLIKSSSEQVGTGVKLVGETGDALKKIVEKVIEINTLVGEMAQAAKQQSTGIEEVNTAVTQMDQVTQQNAAMVEESTAASHSLAGDADELARLIGKFKVGGIEAAESAPVRARSDVRPEPHKLAVAQGAAVSRLTVPSTEEWSSF